MKVDRNLSDLPISIGAQELEPARMDLIRHCDARGHRTLQADKAFRSSES
jgi:hypothetical protein